MIFFFFLQVYHFFYFLKMANAIQQLNTVAMKKVVEEEKGAVLVRLYQPHDTARENLTYIILCNVYNEHLRHHRENPEDNFE